MKELIEKLNHTGIKFLDLVDKGLDKLPDGIGALWEAAVLRAQITGVVSLIAASIGIIGCGWLVYTYVESYKKVGDITETCPFYFILVLFAAAGVIGCASCLFQPKFWFMAFYPEQYILSELMLNFIK